MIGVSYVVTYRSEGASRRANLEAILAWLGQFSGLEVTVVEQDRSPTISGVIIPGQGTHLFAFNPGAFNKSWGFNVGFKYSSGQVIAFGDADVMVDAETPNQSFESCLSDYDAVKPYDRLIDLTPEETKQVLAGESPILMDGYGRSLNREGIGEYICFCGGLFVMRRALFEFLGGFDEKFLGWGAEDDAMTVKLHTLSQSTQNLTGHTAYHLWHEQLPHRRFGQPFYQRNLARLRQYQGLGPARMRILCERQRRSMGNIHKYAFPNP